MGMEGCRLRFGMRFNRDLVVLPRLDFGKIDMYDTCTEYGIRSTAE